MKRGRKPDPDKREPFGLRLRGSIRKRIDTLAKKQNRTLANMAEEIILRGLDVIDNE